MDTTAGRAFRSLLTQPERHPDLHAKVLALFVQPGEEVIADVFRAASDRGEIDHRVITPLLVSSGPQLVLGQHIAAGRVTESEITAIVDEMILPAAARIPLALTTGESDRT
ncbi:hypothetical protein GCM10020295_26430 [Streptomyces cinereospinus]